MKKKRSLFLMVLCITFLSGLFFVWKRQAVAPSLPIPTRAVLFPTDFQKRLYQPVTASESLNGHPQNVLSILQSFDDDSLVGLRCSERISYENPIFFIREANTHKARKHVEDEPFITILREAARSVAAPDTFLRAQFCETETGDILFEYTSGTMIGHHPDNAQDATAYLSYFKKDGQLTPGIFLIHYDVWPYPGCRTPLALTTTGRLFYECGIAAAGEVNTTYHQIDLVEHMSDQIAKCFYTYKGKPAKIC